MGSNFGKSKKTKAKEKAEKEAKEAAAKAKEEEDKRQAAEAAAAKAKEEEIAAAKAKAAKEEQERLWAEAEKAEELLLEEAENRTARAKTEAALKYVEDSAKLQEDQATQELIPDGDNITEVYEFQNPQGGFSTERESAVVLGSGAFGRVLKGRNITTHARVAIKEISKQRMNNADDRRTMKKEVQLLRDCSGNDHVLAFKAFYECENYYDIVTEEADGGELHEKLAEIHQHLDEEVIRNIAFSLLDAVAFLQKHNIAHRDIKPENILLRENELNGNILLCDFGFATKCNGKSLKKNCGSTAYMAPEVLKGDYYDFRCDVWSVGITIYQLITGQKPFNGSDTSIENNVIRCKGFTASDDRQAGININDTHPAFANMSLFAKQVVCLCLDPIQERRPLAKQILDHAWFHHFTKLESTDSVEKDTNNIKPVVTSIEVVPEENEESISESISETITESFTESVEKKTSPFPAYVTTSSAPVALNDDLEKKMNLDDENGSTIGPVRMNSSVIEVAPTIRAMDKHFNERQKQAEEYSNVRAPPPTRPSTNVRQSSSSSSASSSKPVAPPPTNTAIRPTGRWFPSLFSFRNTCYD